MTDIRTDFSGAIPANYEAHLVPFCFRTFAEDLAGRIPQDGQGSILEIAAGTGALTDILRRRLPPMWTITATDKSESMLAVAREKTFLKRGVQFEVAAAEALPQHKFYDYVICQFGIMFFEDLEKALSEISRVLKPGGRFLFNVWDSLNKNEVFKMVDSTIREGFPNDPMETVSLPFSMFDPHKIRETLHKHWFIDLSVENVKRTGISPSAHDLATGLFKGTPLSLAIADRDPSMLEPLCSRYEQKLIERFGKGRVYAQLEALVCGGRKMSLSTVE